MHERLVDFERLGHDCAQQVRVGAIRADEESGMPHAAVASVVIVMGRCKSSALVCSVM
jgi:hypothetical protein